MHDCLPLSIVVVSSGKIYKLYLVKFERSFFSTNERASLLTKVAAVSKPMLQMLGSYHVNTFGNSCFYFFASLRLDFFNKDFSCDHQFSMGLKSG